VHTSLLNLKNNLSNTSIIYYPHSKRIEIYITATLFSELHSDQLMVFVCSGVGLNIISHFSDMNQFAPDLGDSPEEIIYTARPPPCGQLVILRLDWFKYFIHMTRHVLCGPLRSDSHIVDH